MRKKLIVLTTILGLIAFSGVAAAQEHDPEDTEETGDTTFNYGYDEENGVFIWGSSASDGDFDCTLENGNLEAVYGNDQDGGLLVEDLTYLEGDNADQTVEFEPTGEGDSVAYTDEGHDCELTAGEVAGPQGQVNHGMFLKLFNAMFDGEARGCMVRHIAQSDFGKGEQQVNVSEVEETQETDGTEVTDEVTGSVDFETVLTDCVNGDDENGEVDGQAKAAEMRPGFVNDMLEDKAANGEDDDDGDQVESQDEDSGQQGPPDHARGKGPKG